MEKSNPFLRNKNLGPLFPQTAEKKNFETKSFRNKANHRSKPPDSPEEANGSLSTCIEGLTGQSVSHSSWHLGRGGVPPMGLKTGRRLSNQWGNPMVSNTFSLRGDSNSSWLFKRKRFLLGEWGNQTPLGGTKTSAPCFPKPQKRKTSKPKALEKKGQS